VGVNQSVLCEDVDELEVVLFAADEVIVVVCGRYFDSACPEIHVDEFWVQNDGDSASIEGVQQLFIVEMGLTGIIRMHSYCCVPQHSFQTSSCYNYFVRFVL